MGRRTAAAMFTALALTVAVAAPAAAQAAPRGPSAPELIERAERAGEIGPAKATLYRTYALRGDPRLPARMRGRAPWDGTLVAREVLRSLPTLEPSATKAAIGNLLTQRSTGPLGLGTSTCLVSTTPMPDTVETPHFYVEYNALTLGRDGLTIADFTQSLEGAWLTEIDAFGWPAPPVLAAAPPPGGKYHVRIDELGPLLYGYVSNLGSHAGPVGDNPATGWDDRDADASCMTLNADYSNFPGSPRRALDATTAHEFNHSIQYGYGALNGEHVPDDIYVEGGATWMEDEVYDAADDNYNYLWPVFEDDMGQYDDSPYPYWIAWRGLLERYGAGRPGGSEQTFQRFWEMTSQETAGNLAAMDQALRERGTTLPDAFHAYAIAVKFNKRCTNRVPYPYCFEEGPEYVAAAGPTQPHGSIAARGGSYAGSIADHHAINWVVLPSGGAAYDVQLTNASSGGALRGTVVCDTGSRLVLAPLSAVAGPGETVAGRVDPRRCVETVAVLTNEAQASDDPSASEERAYTLSTTG